MKLYWSQKITHFVTCLTNRKPNQRLLPRQCERWTRRWTSRLTRTAWTPTAKPFTIVTSSWVLTEWLQPSTTWKPVSAVALSSHLLSLCFCFDFFFLFCFHSCDCFVTSLLPPRGLPWRTLRWIPEADAGRGDAGEQRSHSGGGASPDWVLWKGHAEFWWSHPTVHPQELPTPHWTHTAGELVHHRLSPSFKHGHLQCPPAEDTLSWEKTHEPNAYEKTSLICGEL